MTGDGAIKKAKQLSRYYKVTIASFKQFTQTPVVDYFKIRFARDSIQKSIYTLWAFAFNNITSKAFSDSYKSRIDTHSCKDYFDSFSDSQIDMICNSNQLSLDNYQGIVTWTIAMYWNFDTEYRWQDEKDWAKYKEWNAHKFIEEQLGVGSKLLDHLMGSSYIAYAFADIQKNILNQFGCFQPGPCNRKFLAEQQYYLGKVTSVGLNTTGFCKNYPSINQRSVSGFAENLPILKNKIPEIYGFFNIHYSFDQVIFGGESDVIFSNNAGSIINYYQMMVMHDFSVKKRTSDQAHLFNIWSSPEYFVHYVDHLFFEWYLDGLIAPISVKDLTEGYKDETILRLSSIGELYGGLQNVSPDVSFGVISPYTEKINFKAGDPANLETYKSRSVINTINDEPVIKGWRKDIPINSTVPYSGKPMEYLGGNSFYHHELRKNLVFQKSKSLKYL